MPLPITVWILPSVAALLAAWAVQRKGGIGSIRQKLLGSQPPSAPQYATWVIGDLHGDAKCAQYWVQKTGLLGTSNNWTDPTSHLVFVGDYVDKGPESKQVVEYVKQLTDQFPQHVTALLGNHEMELLLDRDPSRYESLGGTGYFGLAYSSVHPGEYLNYLTRIPDKEDHLVVEALYNASVEVYGSGLHQQMRMAPNEHVGDEKSILRFIQDDTLRALATTRLMEYQTAYIDAYRSDTELGKWLETRPIVAQINDTLFVHGGISGYGSALVKQLGVEEVNRQFAEKSNQETIQPFITETQIGQIMYNMVTFRGNHQPENCQHLAKLLPEGVVRLGVGHTPSKTVRILCDGQFLAIDSSLGRWFRNSGNMYCPGQHKVSSSNGRYTCGAMVDSCEGQIVKLTAGNPPELIQ